MSWSITLPISKPLSLNDREHWATRSRRVRQVREAVADAAGELGIPQLNRPRVTLHYSPRDRRRRDALNLAATLKACEDGLTDAGVLIDDDTEHYLSRMPVIEPPNGEVGRLWLLVESVCPRCRTEGMVDAEFCMVTCPTCHGEGYC